MLTIFFYGCQCGTTGARIRKVKAYAKENNIEVSLKNSKYSEDARIEHAAYLAMSDISTDSYIPIVVNGESVVSLDTWKF